MKTIGFIGIGKLGLPCAEEIAKAGYTVYGYDLEVKMVDKVIQVFTIEELVSKSNIVFIAVPTPHHSEYDGRYPTAHLEPKDFNYSIVEECLKEANLHMTKDQLLVLISTVLPGTTRKLFSRLVNNTRFIYNPYLIAMGSVAWDFINPEMVMIGTEDGSITGPAQELITFYQTIMQNNPRYEVGTWDECECIKVFYNTFISTKIALVNMVQDVAMKQGNINVDVVTNALSKSTMRITGPQYLTAGMGDGGACHPRDNIALRYMAKELDLGYDLFDSIMNARQIQAENMAKELVKYANLHNLPIYIHGKSYKPGVSYCDGSYSILVAYYCESMGEKIEYIDPLTNDIIEEVKGVVLLAHNFNITYKYTKKFYINNLYCKILPGSIIVDPWRKYSNEDKSIKVVYYGNTRNNKL
jgi:UDPglucose 6-dehydrogenase